MIIIVMGVSGSGKSTVGAGLAAHLGIPFFEGDAFHPESNVDKMSNGIPLTDEDRRPWVAAIADALNTGAAPALSALPSSASAVLACSALTRFVRKELCARVHQPCLFVHLRGDKALIRARLEQRPAHFMKPGMLDSQFAALETPEDCMSIPVDRSAPEIIDEIERRLAALL
jgi:gluconokinase